MRGPAKLVDTESHRMETVRQILTESATGRQNCSVFETDRISADFAFGKSSTTQVIENRKRRNFTKVRLARQPLGSEGATAVDGTGAGASEMENAAAT